MSRKEAPKIDHPYIFSVSQAQTFRLCPRKWAYLKIDGIEDPGSDATKLGSAVHDQLEKYLEKGTPIKSDAVGRIAMSALPHLPPPMHPGMEVEAWFHVQIGDAYYRGLKDLEIRKGFRNKGVPFVSDHKTTKNFMWIKSEKDLTGGELGVGDVQAGVYAYDTMIHTGASEVDLQWTYMRTTGAPSSEPVCTIINRDQVDRIIRELEVTTVEMIRVKKEHPTASTVEQDPTGCEAFGGCPYKDLCNLTPKEKFKAMMIQNKKESGVLAKLLEKKAKKSGGEAPKKLPVVEQDEDEDDEEDEDEPVGVSAAPKNASVMGKLLARKKARKESPQKETPSPVEEDDEATDSAVNPPENEKSPVVTVETQEAEKKSKKAAKTTKIAASIEPVVQHSSGLFSSAVDAFLDVLLDGLAARIAEKLKK